MGIDGDAKEKDKLEMLNSIIETLEVMADKELMESVRRAEEDVKAGRVRPLEEFLKELDEKEA